MSIDISKINVTYVIITIISLLIIGIFSKIITGNRDPGVYQFEMNCQSCHLTDGRGLEEVIPPLANSDWLKTHQDTLPCIIRHGLEGKIVVNGKEYENQMPGNKKLTEGQMLNIINYINNKWGNDYERMTLLKLHKILRKCGGKKD